MATEIREAGYEELRDYIESNWSFIELRDGSGAAVTRIDVSSDGRGSWVHADGDQVLEIELTVQGSDSDIPTGTTFSASALFSVDTATGGSELSWDSFPDATIETSDDQLVVTHQVEVPQV